MKWSTSFDSSCLRFVAFTAQLWNSSNMDSESSLSTESSVSSLLDTTKSSSSTFETPLQIPKKQVVCGTNAQILADNLAKAEAKKMKQDQIFESFKSNAKTVETKVKQDTKVKTEDAKVKTETAATTIDIQGTTFPVQQARSNWSLKEQIALIDAYKTWDESTKNSLSKKLMSISRIWLIHIPTIMGKSFGRVRVTTLFFQKTDICFYRIGVLNLGPFFTNSYFLRIGSPIAVF
jgi:lipopolysaccharide export system protein LptC